MDVEDSIYEIETDDGRRFQLKIQVPQQFYVQIVNPQGNYRKWLQMETNSSILVPIGGFEDLSIIIEGTTKGDVLTAKNRIDFILNGPRESTHCLSISCANEEIKSSFLRFKDDVLKVSAAYDESLFEKPEKLHFKMFTLVLPHNQDTVIALECLEECKKMIAEKFLQDGPLKVTMAGLSSMNDNPSVCRLLYVNIVPEKMQEVANEVATYFESRGMIKLEEENVKLRVTLMNAECGYRRKSDTGRTMRWNFDATGILEKFKNYHFGSFTVNEIHLSKLCGAKGPNSYFESAGVIKF